MPEVFRFDVDANGPVPWLDGVFLGWQEQQPPFRSFVMSSLEDSVAILGPPRVGKTSGVMIPQAMMWPGSLISASTKPDVLRATRGRRLEAAVHRGGDVFVYAPADPRSEIGGVRALRWSPADGCENPTVCEIRVQKMLGPEKPIEEAFFRQAAAAVMRGYFHAAALSHCGMRRVKRWVDTMDVAEAIHILNDARDRSPAADGYASALEGIEKQPPNTKAGTFGTVNEKLAALVGNATALANADEGDFDVDDFLNSGSTMYIVSPEDTQGAVAPLVAGLIEAIVSRAYNVAAQQPNGRLDPPLLLLLDEVGAIAPLPSLPAIMAQGAGQGVIAVWAAQSISQLKARWGEDWAASIWNASTQKLLFGNLGDADLLERISQMFGEYDRRVSPYGDGIQRVLAVLAQQNTPPTLMRERKLQVSELHGLPPQTAALIALTPGGRAVHFVGTPPAGLTAPFQAAQQLETLVQERITTGPLTPAELRDELFIATLFESIPTAEQERFRLEESELLARISSVERLTPDRQRAALADDPSLARELLGIRGLRSLPRAEQSAFRCNVVRGFADGWMPHVSFASAAPRTSPRRRGRPPEPYRHRAG